MDYLQVVQHFVRTPHRGEAFFLAPTVALGVRALFETVLDCLDDPATPSPVCLMAGSMTHEVMADPDLRDYVQRQMSMVAEQMVERLSTDKEAGHLSVEFDARLVMPIVFTYLHGIWRMAMFSYDRATFERQIDLFMTSLGL